jgi:hypothetical protein
MTALTEARKYYADGAKALMNSAVFMMKEVDSIAERFKLNFLEEMEETDESKEMYEYYEAVQDKISALQAILGMLVEYQFDVETFS